jgi:hypothetical protein
VAKKFENPFAGGIQGLNKQITAGEVAKYKNNPAYNVTDHGVVKHDAPVASPYKPELSGEPGGVQWADAAENTRRAKMGGMAATEGKFQHIEAEIDREWMRDAMLSAVPEEKKYAPAPAWKGGRNDPFKMQFDLNSYYPWLKKEEEKDRYG